MLISKAKTLGNGALRKVSILVSNISHYDAATAWFDLSRYEDFGQAERVAVGSQKSQLWTIDSRALLLKYDYAPKIALIQEGAAYRSRLELKITGNTEDQVVVFEDLSAVDSIYPEANAPLQIGDWIQLSEISAQSQLHFEIFPNGVLNPHSRMLSTDTTLNPDAGNAFGAQFWVAYADPSATLPLLLLGFEDIVGRGSDNDYNDGIIAIDVGPENFAEIFAIAKIAQIDENSTIADAQVDLSQTVLIEESSQPDLTHAEPVSVPEGGTVGACFVVAITAIALHLFKHPFRSGTAH